MNKALKEKLLFITGGVIAIFGLVIFQQNFPSSLDSSKFLAQVPGENIYEECISDPTKIIQNGNFEQFINGAQGPTYALSDIGSWVYKEVCFFESLTNHVEFDIETQSNVLRTFYMKHVFDGNPDNVMFGLDQTAGVVQYIPNLEPGEYEISLQAKKDTAYMQEEFEEGLITLYIAFSEDTILPMNYNFSWCTNQNMGFGVVNSTNLMTQVGLYDDCILSQFDTYTEVIVNSENYFDEYVANISITNPNLKYMYIFPYGITPEWDPIPWSNSKPYSHVYIDNITVNLLPESFTCGITFQGEGDFYYSNLDGEYVLHEGGSLDIEVIGNQYPENVDEDSFYLYSPVPGVLNVKAPTDVTYTDADILELFSLQGGSVISATSFSGSNFWIEYECLIACTEFSEDLNQDGIVDEMDIEAFMPFFGQFCSNLETCQFDLDNDGIITVQDMMILISAVGQECGLPISPSASNPDETSGPENTTYSSQGNFVKPTKIPGLQKPYNYIVNTKVLDTKQTALRIEQFFPSNMILRGLYSSTKNISLVSKEGIVRFFNLGKTTAVKSYLYLEADPEICKTVSQNKKAYTELVSYGLCK